MVPPLYDAGGLPPSTFLPPETGSRGILQRKAPDHVHPVQGNKLHQANGTTTLPRQLRPLTVNEALQYSPLSSIVPFDSGIIPFPTSGLPDSQPMFLNPSEQRAARKGLDILDRDLTNGQGKLAQHALGTIKPALDSDAKTTFKFKALPGFQGKLLHRASNPSTANSGQDFSSSRLGPFAKMVYNATDVVFTYPTPSPSSPGSVSSKLETFPKVSQQNIPSAPTTPQRHLQNEVAYTQNNGISVDGADPSTSQRAKLQPVVVVPPLPPSLQPSEYKTFEDQHTAKDSNGGISRKRKHDQIEEIGDSSTRVKDQKAISCEALNSLQDLIHDIFDAEEQATDNVSVANAAKATQIVFSNYGEDENSLHLTSATHVKLESSLHKVTSLGRFAEVPLDHLLRLQGLCESTITSAGPVEVTIGPGADDGEGSRWLERVDTVDLGLRSARTILRIMCGGREEKQLYSEELLQKVLDGIRKIIESCVIPVVESRTIGSNSEVFTLYSTHKKAISQLVHNVSKSMLLISELLIKMELAESTVTSLEFFLTRLLFVENAHSEKESVLGIYKFENLRRIAMDIIAEIFSRYSEQRTFLFDEILSSLQKLPVTRQHARQFKLVDGKGIQLVSALIIRLVQTSGMQSISALTRKRLRTLPNHGGQNSLESSQSDDDEVRASEHRSGTEGDEDTDATFGLDTENTEAGRAKAALSRLSDDATLLHNSSTSSAQYVARFFVHRASTASKTGDQPHRHLLDIFSEDLISVLGMPDWPGAQLLLRALLSEMLRIVQSAKSTAPAKNMALELLGLMGSAISDLTAGTRHLARTLENDDSQFSSYLVQLMDDHVTGSLEKKELLKWEGPFRAVLEYLHAQGLENLQSVSAQGYLLTQWSKSLCFGKTPAPDSPEDLNVDRNCGELAVRLRKMLLTGKWCITDDFDDVSSNQSRLAYALIVLNLDFCQAFNHILKILLDSISSDQITVRTRSLKSVTQMLEKDPTLLDRAPVVIKLISKCASDTSSMVRDSALVLLGKCMLLKPALEDEIYKIVVVNTHDSAIGVRKRSMRLLKDIYLRNSHRDIKSTIADNLLQRAQDPDEGVSDLARQIFEDIWLSPFWIPTTSTTDPVHAAIALKEQVSLIIRTVRRGESVTSVLDSLLRQVLSNKSKNAVENFNVCKSMVAAAFEGIIESDELPGKPEQQHILQALTVFAKANPRLFDAQQLQHLQPYVGNLSSADDLNLFRSVVVTLRCVLPTLPIMQLDFLRNVQVDLLKSVGKLGKSELNEVVACLWSINGKLDNIERLVTLTASVLRNMHELEGFDFNNSVRQDHLLRIKRYIRIAGHFGKHCDFESQIHAFRIQLPWFTGDSVAGFIISSIQPYAAAKQPLTLRVSALDGIGLICQAWPRQFNRKDVAQEFQGVLRGGHPDLQHIVLSSFRDFFATQDRQAGPNNEVASEEVGLPTNGRLGGSMVANDNDGAAALIAQGFLKEILKLALASQDDYALTATQVIASINRQGLVHPKECGPALVALETSTNPEIAGIAFQEHRNLHQQHESMFEREYMRAIHEAFVYQKNIVQNPLGATGQPHVSKLRSMFEVIKISKGKYQKKFLSNVCTKIDFDPAKLDVSATPPSHLEYSRFLAENLAFFDYGRLDELQHIISCIEKVVAGTGAGIAHAINTEVFNVVMEHAPEGSGNLNIVATAVPSGNEDVVPGIEPTRLRQLTTGSMILSILWEARTFLRRLYGLSSNQQRRDSKTKASVKDLNKTPSKVHGVTGDRVMEVIGKISNALDSRDSMLDQCKQFAQLLSIDDEVKIHSEEDQDEGRNETPSVDDDGDIPMPASVGSRAGKRKSSVSVAGTPQKRKKGRPSLGNRRKSGKSVEVEEESS